MNLELLAGIEVPDLDVVNRKRLALVVRQATKFRESLISQLNQSSRYIRREKFDEEVHSLCEKECKVLALRLRSAIDSGEVSAKEEDEVLKYTQELMVKAGISKVALRAIWERASKI